VIRDYEISDWKEVCRVFNAAKPLELATAQVESSFVPLEKDEPRLAAFSRSTVIVWHDRAQVVGFAGYEGAYIGWLFVDPPFFRRGIARALLRAISARIGGKAWLWCMKSNAPALALYYSEGFEIVDQRETQNRWLPCTAVKLSRKEKEPSQA
jgi:ribosomal protein S18 acetylase RimI-like enzyme